MKKLTVLLSVLLVLCTAICCVSVACTPDEPDLTGLNAAKDYLEAQLRDVAAETSADYTRPTALRNEHGTFTVTWTVSVTSGDANGVTVGEPADGTVTINVDEMANADIVYVLTATIADANGNTVTSTFNHKVPKLNLISVADFIALETGDTVYAIEGYVMASGANEDYAGSFVVADSTGAIFSYSKKIVNVGDKVLVWGNRSVNAGVAQINTTDIKVLEANSQSYAEATATELRASDLDLSALNDAAMPSMTGIYYKVTGATLTLSDTGYTNANYKDKQLLSLYVNDAIEAAAADLYDETVNVYGYVRGYKNGTYLTMQVTKIEYGGEGEFVPKTAEEKVAYEKSALSLDTIAFAGETELPTKGSRYSAQVAISWALADNAVATLADNVLTIAELPAERTTLTLTATITCGEVTDTATVTVDVRETWAALENKTTEILKTYTELAAASGDTNKYATIGWIVEIDNPKYGNVYIQNAEGEKFYVYGVYGHDGEVRFDSLPNQPEVGDVVVLKGVVTTYNNNPQLKNAWLLQVNDTVCVDTPEYVMTVISAEMKGSVSANFELNEKATWAVKDGTAITLEGTAASVTVTKEEQTVVLTATVTIGEDTLTKDFTVKVVPPSEITVAEALTADAGTVVVFTGVVTGSYSSGTNSFYVTNGASKILVYSPDIDTALDLNTIVEVLGTISVYNGVNQITNGATVTTKGTHTCETYTDATCTKAPVCTLCNADKVGGAALGHTDADPADGICDSCQYDMTQIVASETIANIATANSWANNTQYTTFSLDQNISVAVTYTGSYNNTGKYYTNGNNWRIYQNEAPALTLSAAEGYQIVSVKITYSIKNTGCLTNNGANVASDEVVTVNGSTITFGVGNTGSATNGQAQITAIEVLYKAVIA